MKTYFSTFVAGTQEIVGRALRKRKNKIKIKLLLDGLVVYESSYPEREIRNLRFFNNTFVLLRFFKSLKPSKQSLEEMIALIARGRGLERDLVKNLPPRRKFFKVVASLENQTISVERGVLQSLESKIFQVDRNLRLSIKNSDLEFWFLLRREGHGFFGIRITYPYGAEGHREKGELRREVAHIMSFLSDPGPRDVILDPFAGHGAISLERAISFPYQKIIAVESDESLFKGLRRKLKNKNVRIIYGSALALGVVGDHSVNKIITDPPWGMFQKVDASLSDFYSKMLKEFSRALKKNGIAVVLIGQPEVFEGVLHNSSEEWKLLEKYPVLISGRKATLYKIYSL